MAEPFKSMDGMVWVLPDGPNTQAYPLACFTVTDLTKPRGDNTPYYCQDPSGPGRYKIIGKSKSPPGLITVSLEGYIESRFAALEEILCQATVIITQTKAGRKDRLTNWSRAWVLTGFDITSESISNLVGRDTDDPAMMSFDANANDLIRLLPFRSFRQSTTQATAINSIFACDEDVCQSEFSVSHRRGDTLYATTDAAIGSATGTANVLYKDSASDESSAWAAVSVDPFGPSENISAGVCFAVDNDTSRILVFRGVTDVGNPAEAAYIERTDGVFGSAWTTVNIGTVNGEFVSSPKAAFALDSQNIWVGTNLGRIYYSENGGASWTVQEDAAIHTADWQWIQFIDPLTGFAGGDAGVVAVTTDGGVTWSQMTSPDSNDITCGFAFNPNQFWVGDADGRIWYTRDGGITWAERNYSGSGSGTVDDMSWINDHVGMLSHRSALNVSTIYMTKDGGRIWESVPTLANAGLNKLFMVNNRLAYAAGETQGGTAVVLKLNPA